MKHKFYLPIFILGLLCSACSKGNDLDDSDYMQIAIGDFEYIVSKSAQTAVVYHYYGDSSTPRIPSSITVGRKEVDVTGIYDWAFQFNDITSVVIPNSITYIGHAAFMNCTYLSSISIPNEVTTIHIATFENCRSLTSIKIPKNVTGIGPSAFAGCNNLKKFEIECQIPPEAHERSWGYEDSNSWIYDCTLNVPKGTVDKYADAEGWKEFGIITDGVTTAGTDNFKVVVIGSLTYNIYMALSNRHAVLANGRGVSGYCKIPESITVDNIVYPVTEIGERAFYNNSKLTSVSLPNSIKTIETCAFSECSNLSSISIPNSVTKIGDLAFDSCKKLSAISIPNSITEICYGLFIGCSNLSSVTIPSSVTVIGDRAFYNCENLTDVYCYALQPPTLGSAVFNYYIAALHVPSASFSAYLKVADKWMAQSIECDL